MAKKIITENKVILNERGEVEFILNEETSRLGHVSIEEGKRLIAQIIMQKNGDNEIYCTNNKRSKI